ncbi:MAG: amidohydrolase [Chloroflexia bacterium]|nr:amidohydrolase [Chloroflexia bacterium]
MEFRKDVEEILPGVVADRRHLHEHPELAFEEYETSKFVSERLASLGVEDLKTGVGGTGVTGLIHGGKGDGKVVMVRADMDALPILEENDVAYKSTKPGVMHACGHDAHTAMLLGLTRLLMDVRSEFAGTVKVLFQPAEEVPPGGAIGMIEDGALENPRVDAVLGLHVSSETQAGKIGMRSGSGSASSDRFRITVKGKGGHAASPHQAVDPVVIGSQIVLAFQTLVSRETNPIDSAVVSTTAFIAGEAFNVIPDTAELRGTVRTLDQDVREHLEKRLTEIAAGIGKAGGAEVVVDFIRGYPGIVNDPEMTDLVRNAAIASVGEDNVIESPISMGGEDFSYFSLERPGCFFNVGTRNEERGIVWGHHHPRFDVEEEGMSAGIATMGNAVLAYLDS